VLFQYIVPRFFSFQLTHSNSHDGRAEQSNKGSSMARAGTRSGQKGMKRRRREGRRKGEGRECREEERRE
jgi:hypothetical protein